MKIAKETEREFLQIVLGFAAVVPFLVGLRGVFIGTPLEVSKVFIDLDSHFVYLSGVLMGMGIAFWHCVRKIERRVETVRILCAIAFMGGLCRLLSWASVGEPSAYTMGGMVMELVVAPAIGAWTTRIGRLYGTWK
jgi:hypothetical protein